MDRLLNWLLDQYAMFMRWKYPPSEPTPQPSSGKVFIIVGDFAKAWSQGKSTGKINGLPCTINYKAGVVTITLKETA
jgi:hypothetical protein